MLKIYSIKEKKKYIKEIAELTQLEWGTKSKNKKEYKQKLHKKQLLIKRNLKDTIYCKLILLEGKNLVGFISIFREDGKEMKELTPCYATMYVKKEYRGKGYSKILNEAILKEAKKKKISKIYLKTTLKNYYEKFGAIYLKTIENEENIYYFD